VIKKIILTVTNDLTFDQRMIRICTSLAGAGYDVKLVGRKMAGSVPPSTQPFGQKRINCLFKKGFFFYAEYNTRLFFYLLFKKADCLCAIDLDTILPVYFASRIKKTRRVYDAHELFCEMKEIVTRPGIYKIWKGIERFAVPRFQLGYTVNQPIAAEFKKMYKVSYDVVRNISLLEEYEEIPRQEKFIIYQGAVNEGRSFETLIPAMATVGSPLVICGDGNFMEEVKQLARKHVARSQVIFMGQMKPAELKNITRQAYIGITLFDKKGLSNYFSLANRFFDYIHAGIPQLCVDYPVYNELNTEYGVAVLVEDLSPENLATQLNNLLTNEVLYETLRQNCLKARQVLNWQQEEKILLDFYKRLFG